ncbi:isoprenoid biosynthesis glyoxalase ElbB [Celerinatantimonas sp. YJH-8]|uniref:isoprenoid biosynthesis glyoxalase ElbB n=1 Tax=Celerinatantimonas sp. YJH-8 TaxID=3228714 RepID=UPI0038C6A76A
MKIAVLLSGCGVYDGSEIQESVLSLLAISQAGHQYTCFAPDIIQTEVINHLNGELKSETRNVLEESARIARGQIQPLTALRSADFDALWLPGGFGVAKNLTRWATQGPDGAIEPSVAAIIQEWIQSNKPLAALCMAPTTVAKALQGTHIAVTLTIGNQSQPSPYDIAAIEAGIKVCGANPVACLIGDITIDRAHKLVTAPCYMMETTLPTLAKECQDIVAALEALV